MLWRQSYRTAFARDIALPKLHHADGHVLKLPEVLIGGFSIQAFRQISIWRRLIYSQSSSVQVLVAYFNTASDALLAVSPPSERSFTFACTDPESAWKNLIEPTKDEECFAAVTRGEVAAILMRGAPTEDAWDTFSAELA